MKTIFPVEALRLYQKKIGKEVPRNPKTATLFRKELVKLKKHEKSYIWPYAVALMLPDPSQGATDLDLIHLENACLYHLTRKQIDKEIKAQEHVMTRSRIGFLGGSQTSKTKAQTSAENGRKSKGRPKKTASHKV